MSYWIHPMAPPGVISSDVLDELWKEDGNAQLLASDGPQNTADEALDGDEPAHLHVTIDEVDVASNGMPPLLEEIVDHAARTSRGRERQPEDFDVRCRYMKFEDYRTKGLVGDVMGQPSSDPGIVANFANFNREIGVSAKPANKKGGVGVGRTIFNVCSKVGTQINVTRRYDDADNIYMMGMALLGTRDADTGAKHYPVSTLGMADADPNVPAPYSDPDEIEALLEPFGGVHREESGLSVIVPYLNESITEATLAAAIVAVYHEAILEHQIEVTIGTEASTTYQLTADSIVDEAEALHEAELLEYKHLLCVRLAALRAAGATPRYEVTLDHGDDYDLYSALTSDDREAIARLLEEFSTVEVCVDVPIDMVATGGTERATFSVTLSGHSQDLPKAYATSRAQLVVARNAINLPEGYVALVQCGDDELAACLKKSEEASHGRWRPTAPDLNRQWRVPRKIIGMVLRSPSSIIASLRSPDQAADVTAFADLFPDPSTGKGGRRRTGGRGRRRTQPISRRLIDSFTAESVTTISPASDRTLAGKKIAVSAIYDTSSGVPREELDIDFSAGGTSVRATRGARILDVGENSFVVAVIDDDFEVTIDGLDPSRIPAFRHEEVS